jgi:hypothetical protein
MSVPPGRADKDAEPGKEGLLGEAENKTPYNDHLQDPHDMGELTVGLLCCLCSCNDSQCSFLQTRPHPEERRSPGCGSDY